MEDLNIKPEEFIKRYVRENTFWYYFWRFLFPPIAYLVYRPKFKGRKNIPAKGGVILASNHIHMPDPCFVLMCTGRVVRYLAKRELLDSKLGLMYRGLQTIPVDREAGAHNSMLAAEYALNKGEIIGIFPEGTRNRNKPGKLLPFKYGTVKIASVTGAPIVPIALMSKGRPFLDDYRINVGEPYYVDKDADLEKENEILKEKIYDLMRDG